MDKAEFHKADSDFLWRIGDVIYLTQRFVEFSLRVIQGLHVLKNYPLHIYIFYLKQIIIISQKALYFI